MKKVLALNFMIALLGMSIANAGHDHGRASSSSQSKADANANNSYGGTSSSSQSKKECIQKCFKELAEEYKECANTATMYGAVRNDTELNKCKDRAKNKNAECKKNC